jgi:septal ring factor EnvC (AmiA/AmiB activator)
MEQINIINNKEIQTFIQNFLNNKNIELQDDLSDKFNSILDDFKQYYVFSHKNPNYEEYTINYERSKTQLQTMMNSLTQQQNNLEQKMSEFNKFSSLLQNEIEQEQHVNQLLKKEAGSIHSSIPKNTKNKSNIMLENSITTYTQQKIKNIGLVVGILFLIYLTVKI